MMHTNCGGQDGVNCGVHFRNFYIASGFDLHLKAIKKEELLNSEL